MKMFRHITSMAVEKSTSLNSNSQELFFSLVQIFDIKKTNS